MTNQTIENMELIVVKIVEVSDANNNGIKFESTQEIKTLINTYGTLLSDIRRLDKDEYEELNAEKELYEQGEKLKLVTNAIDETVIPTELNNGSLKSVDNLAIASSKIKSILRDIKWMTNKHQAELKSKEFKVGNVTNELLEHSISTGILVHQIGEQLRGTGKTTSIIKKAHELDCVILTMGKVSMNYSIALAKEMCVDVAIVPVTEWKMLGLSQYKNKVENGLLIDDVRDLEVLHTLKEKGYKILGGFTA